jgi:hypothetical protein
MKTIAILWLFVCIARAGEISELYWAEKKNNTNPPPTLSAPAFIHRQMAMRSLQLTNGSGRLEIAFGGNIKTNHGVTEIGMERTQCYGTCPAYTFVVSANGRCRYEGGKFAKIQGNLTGQASVITFHRVAEMLLDLKFPELDNEYEPSVTDCPTTFTTAVIKGQRKIVKNYAEGGPSKLWGLEQIIDVMLSQVQWDK